MYEANGSEEVPLSCLFYRKICARNEITTEILAE